MIKKIDIYIWTIILEKFWRNFKKSSGEILKKVVDKLSHFLYTNQAGCGCGIKALQNLFDYGILAQLGEHLPYKQRVIGSSPIGPI